MTAPTPRTDAEELDGAKWDDHRVDRVVPANFARQLERDLATAQEERDEAKRLLQIDGVQYDACLAERDEWKRKAEEAAKALKWIAERYDDSKSTIACAEDAYEMKSVAAQALHDYRAAIAAKGEA